MVGEVGVTEEGERRTENKPPSVEALEDRVRVREVEDFVEEVEEVEVVKVVGVVVVHDFVRLEVIGFVKE
jgi:hypothetical protein